ncbi:Lrp/AsnC ligand binding domain-containing protein [Streptomyces gossypiisoli]|uniref:Lrp/AsnC ligand binding domain-containing protein n=1 Tax=Streptomyces gossypiisoli TaxID=2748864 RepID=UPI001F0E3B83|nr:Lrp/AsnC ligand binding domain-containing protein [Streptomyces sp. Z423-1]
MTTGDADLLARVAARDTEHLHRITNSLLDVPGVSGPTPALSCRRRRSAGGDRSQLRPRPGGGRFRPNGRARTPASHTASC